MTCALTFPGQGSQSVGMGKDLAEAFPIAREVFEEIDDALKQSLSKLMFEGPSDDLTLTENTQPALMAVSIAVTAILQSELNFDIGQQAKFVAGHSLGEYSALAAAGAIDRSDAARLLKRRGQAMQRAVPVGKGAMAAVLGLGIEECEEVISGFGGQDEICAIANDNGAGQVVISGHADAVKIAGERCVEKGAKRAMPLPVSAPFHCALMQPAADEMEEALTAITIAPPIVPVVSNVSVSAESDPETIRSLLVKQVTGRVRWRETVEFFGNSEVDSLLEIGAGKVLTGLAKRINRDLKGINIATPSDIEAFSKTL